MSGKWFSFETDSYYEGAWECDQRHGSGKMIHPDGSIYDGQWKNDMENGQGVLFMANGDVYRGSWKDGKKHGDGEYHFKASSMGLLILGFANWGLLIRAC